MKRGVVRKDSMWDRLIFKKVQVSENSLFVPLVHHFQKPLFLNCTV